MSRLPVNRCTARSPGGLTNDGQPLPEQGTPCGLIEGHAGPHTVLVPSYLPWASQDDWEFEPVKAENMRFIDPKSPRGEQMLRNAAFEGPMTHGDPPPVDYARLLQDLDAFIDDCHRLARSSVGPNDTPQMRDMSAAQEQVYARLAKRLIAVLQPYRAAAPEGK